MGFSELAKEAIDGAENTELPPDVTAKVRGYLNMIETASLRARSLSRGIWDFAKAEPGTFTNINAVDLMDSVQMLTAPAVKVAQIDVARREDPAGVAEAMVHADHALAQQVLVELVLASPASIPGGGLVVWQVSPAGDGAAQIDITTEPWDDVATSEWQIPDYVLESFKEMGGEISSATPVPVTPPSGEAEQELTGWKVVATLPRAETN